MKARIVLALIVLFIISIPSFAGDERNGPVGRMTVSAASVEWQSSGSFDRLVLTVGMPNGTAITREFQGNRATFRISDLAPRVAADGTYVYELRAIGKISDEVKQRLAAARARDDDDAAAKIRAEAGIGEPVLQAGAFSIHNGSFVTDSVEPPAAGKNPKVSANATAPKLTPGANDVVTADDEIIQGSLCVGLDCVVNESFGFDTIRLKENNTRINFTDTSTSAGFPSNDWEITANDSASGGANYLAFTDVTAGRRLFTVTAGAPANSLFVASSGKVGLGTSSPVLNLHINASDTPAIRQEQNNSGGFTAQTWDIGANEANWFVRDVTGGSRLPLRIRPGAPTSSVDISATGKVGINTASPGALLDVGNGAAARGSFTKLLIGPGADSPQMELYATSKSAAMSYDGTILSFFTNGTPFVQAMVVDNSGNVGIGTTGPSSKLHVVGDVRVTGGSFIDDGVTIVAPDYVFDNTYKLMPINELASFIRTEKHLPNVPDAKTMKTNGLNLSQFQMRLLEKVEELTLYTIDLKAENEQLQKRLDQLEQQMKRQ